MHLNLKYFIGFLLVLLCSVFASAYPQGPGCGPPPSGTPPPGPRPSGPPPGGRCGPPPSTTAATTG